MRIKTYQDARGQWRWSAVENNGRIIADGSEGYDNPQSLQRGLKNAIEEFRKDVSITDLEHSNKVVRLFGAAIEETQR